jgi:malonyl-CoA/methylmalonyl-CoA synthetase
MNANVYALFASRFANRLEHPCIETETGRIYTYADIEQETARMANVFAALGLEKGARVAAQVEKSPQALFVYLAALRAGLVYLPLNTAYQRAEVEYFLRDAEPSVFVGQSGAHAAATDIARVAGTSHVYTLDENGEGTLTEAARPARADFQTVSMWDGDLAAILYTSGTTGRSKGAMLAHGNLASNALALLEAWGFTSSDVLLHALPLFHIHGLFVAAHLCLLSG